MGFSPESGAVMRNEVDRLFRDRCGVSYVDLVRDGLEDGFTPLVSSMRSGQTAEDFFNRTARAFDLVQVDHYGPERAERMNRGRAALALYARHNDDGWLFGTDGRAYREEDGGIARLDVVERNGAWGWQIDWAEAPDAVLELSDDGRVVAPDLLFSHRFGEPTFAFDIGDVVERWTLDQEYAVGTGLHTGCDYENFEACSMRM